MNKKFTEGKWIVRTTIDDSGDYPFPTYDILAIHEWGPESIGTAYQNPNNARLFAAAQEMLEAMQWFVDRVDAGEVRSKNTYARFKGIIAKALGE